jgi:hypothetical protein
VGEPVPLTEVGTAGDDVVGSRGSTVPEGVDVPLGATVVVGTSVVVAGDSC